MFPLIKRGKKAQLVSEKLIRILIAVVLGIILLAVIIFKTAQKFQPGT